MRRSRRTFLKFALAGAGTAVAGVSWWVAASKQRTARWARRLIEEGRRPIVAAPFKPTPAHWSDNQITICWVGHSTVLINFYGIQVLTDPALGNRVGISIGLGTLGPKRYVSPALRFNELPPIDVLLLSHAHMDHLDLPTLRKFSPNLFTVTAKSTSDLLENAQLQHVTELPWNGRTTFQSPKGELQIEAVEVKHWGQRWPSDLPRGYNGYVLRREGKALLFAGDSARTPLFSQLHARGPFEAAIMPIGAYRPWIWNHCSPEEAVEMANLAGAKYLVPVHHRTFKLSDEPMNEPIERLTAALEREPERLALSQIGQTFVCPKPA
jgi:L-ascorbate metabolism protein UlaG (beta-lactamase superfamily)